MKKVLKYVVITVLLIAMLFALTGCGNKEEDLELVLYDEEESIENSEEVVNSNEENIPEEVSFSGIYIATDELDTMEGLIILPDGEDNVIVMKDVQGTGIIRAGAEKVKNNVIEHEFLDEQFSITDIGENVKFYHPMMCVEETEMAPATGDFVGVYENEDGRSYLVIYKNFSGEITVAYIDIKYDNVLSATMKDFTMTDTTIEGNDDSYNEPIKITLNGDKLTFNIESEDSRWNNANLEYTLVK